MKIAKTIEVYGRTLGIDGTGMINRRNMLVLTIYVIYFLMSSAFLVYSANSFQDYAMCSFIWYAMFSYKC